MATGTLIRVTAGVALLALLGCAGPSTWDGVFERTIGWTGADCAASIELDRQRALWVYGDSWIGPVTGGRHGPGARMVHNTIAVHPVDPERPWEPPGADAVEFVWGPEDGAGHPTAWLTPTEPIARQSGGEPSWFWASGGAVVAEASAAAVAASASTLVVFFFHVGRTPDARGVWSFRHLGSAMAIVDNPADPVRQWRSRQLEVAFATAAAPPASWGVAALRHAGFVYVYGVRSPTAESWDRDLVLARVPERRLSELAEWRFVAENGRWTAAAGEAAPIAGGMTSELSVEPITHDGRERFVLVQSEPLLGRRVFTRTAARPEGPWSERVEVFSVPDVDRHESYFTYAAKGHAHLSRPGELLVTYLVNASDFGAMVSDTEIYRPRFVRVPLAKIFDE